MNLKNEIRKEKPIPAPGKNTGVKYLFATFWEGTRASGAVGPHPPGPGLPGPLGPPPLSQNVAYRYFTPVFFIFLARECFCSFLISFLRFVFQFEL